MVSVFTPTYNRANLLARLYSSLLEQTDRNFEWIIVDDGSSDNTSEIVTEWAAQNKIKIKYYIQENSGKHVAFNAGIDLADGDLYFCVDSDDFLTTDSIENINDSYETIKHNSAIGIIALKSDTSGKLLSENFPKGRDYCTTFDLTNKYSCFGEKSIIYKTEVLKSHKFPVVENEKFIGECVLYDFLDSLGEMFLLNKTVTVCEYQEVGLSNNFFKIMLKNPVGFKIYHSQRIDLATTFKQRIGYAVRYNAFDFMSNDKKFNYSGKHKILVVFTKPLGWLLKLYYSSKNANSK